ncbi:MAG: hypothetical protein J7L76_00365 [Spirochaetaceae bacterium]|nr:hypothetical protein [Spirochaetaceae bacterium]
MTMKRTQIYLTTIQKEQLASYAASSGLSQSELIRRSVDIYIKSREDVDRKETLDNLAGIWADHQYIPDIRKLRTGWRNRPER